MEGTYPLPEAQLDRFLFKTLVPSPTPAVLESILAETTGHPVACPTTVMQREQLLELQSLCRDVVVPKAVLHYASRITTATDPMASSVTERVRATVRFGAGVRGGQALILGGKARALSEGRPNVSFEDVRAVVKPALRHRLLLSFESESLGLSCDDVLSEVVDGVNELPPEVEHRL
jgi:MoxR-like ATPase